MIAFLASMILSLILMTATTMLITDFHIINWPIVAIIGIILSLVNTLLKPITKAIGANLNPVALGVFMLVINALVFIGICFTSGLVTITPSNIWYMGVAAAAYSIVMYLLSLVLYRK